MALFRICDEYKRLKVSFNAVDLWKEYSSSKLNVAKAIKHCPQDLLLFSPTIIMEHSCEDNDKLKLYLSFKNSQSLQCHCVFDIAVVGINLLGDEQRLIPIMDLEDPEPKSIDSHGQCCQILLPISFTLDESSVVQSISLGIDVSFQPNRSVKLNSIVEQKFSLLQQAQILDNFNVKCGNIMVPFDKHILSSVSNVFEVMILANATKNCITLEDSVEDVVILQKVLSGNASMEIFELSFFQFVRKYDIWPLQSFYQNELVNFISLPNIVSIVQIAEELQDKNILHSIVQFIDKNKEKLRDNQSWLEYTNQCTCIFAKMFHILVFDQNV